MQLDASIFKAYDIRGVFPKNLNENVAYALGMAFGVTMQQLKERVCAVGRDGRLSGFGLSQALIQGLLDSGVNVIDVGQVTTPMLYFAASTLCTSGIQITGSHNPKDYNGFKMVLAGKAIYGEEIQSLRRLMEENEYIKNDSEESAPNIDNKPILIGTLQTTDVFAAYQKRIIDDVKLSRRMKIVIDSGNGIAGASAPAIFKALGCEVIELFSEVDGTFPNHHPDPSKPENLRDLIQALQKSDAEIGLAFDGDGDRLGIVTKDGNNIFPDRQMILFSRDVLSRAPNSEIIFDVKCSQRLAPEIQAAGGKPVMFKTGHSLIKARMRESNSPLGGEMSGHIFFKERWFGFDDGTYAGARLLEIVSRHLDANAVLNNLPQSHSTPELNVACNEGEPHRLSAILQTQAKDFLAQLATQNHSDLPEPTINTIDGLRVDWIDGFGLIRASNTTPVLVLRFEGQTNDALERIQSDMLALLKHVKPDAIVGSAAH